MPAPKHSLRVVTALAGVVLAYAPRSHANPPAASACPVQAPPFGSSCPRALQGRRCVVQAISPATQTYCMCERPRGRSRGPRWACRNVYTISDEVLGPLPPPELDA